MMHANAEGRTERRQIRSWASLAMGGITLGLALGETLAQTVVVEALHAREGSVTIQWSPAEAHQVFTLQERASLQHGEWQAVPTRYAWPLGLTQWTVGREPGKAHFYRVVSEPSEPAERGKLLRSRRQTGFALGSARQRLSDAQVGKLPSDDVNFAVALHQIVYETVDPWGRRIEASGALFLPEGVEGALPLLSYQHGTAIFEDWVPSQNDAFYFPMGLLYASDGYAVFLPDYVGLGESPGFHPYLHAKTEATAVVDGLRAVRAFCAENSVALNDALFLAGYSQGGHATAAAHRELEEFHEDEFTVTASAPMAGPYDLQESLRHILGRTNYPSPAYVVVAMAAWRPIYAWETTFEGMLADDHADTLSALINRRHKYHEVSKGMPSSLERALAPEFVEALREDPEHFLWKASADNDLLDWAPKAPVKLLHCRGDRIVPHENALTAEERWTENGACCVEVEDPGGTASLDHGPCQSKSLVAAKEWFDTFREKADGSG